MPIDTGGERNESSLISQRPSLKAIASQGPAECSLNGVEKVFAPSRGVRYHGSRSHSRALIPWSDERPEINGENVGIGDRGPSRPPRKSLAPFLPRLLISRADFPLTLTRYNTRCELTEREIPARLYGRPPMRFCALSSRRG
jgi:hypothetical protein